MEIPHTMCSHIGYLAQGNNKDEERGRSGHKNNIARDSLKTEGMERRHEGRSPKQGITVAKDLTIELPESPL